VLEDAGFGIEATVRRKRHDADLQTLITPTTEVKSHLCIPDVMLGCH
jgi:hypothetical protein